MKRFIPIAVILLLAGGSAVALTGCGPIRQGVNWVLGIDDGGTSEDPADDKVTPGPASAIADLVIPGAGAALTALIGGWLEIRRRKWKQAAVTTFRGVEEFAKTPVGASVAEDLKATLVKNHTAANVYSFIDKVLDKQKINEPKPS